MLIERASFNVLFASNTNKDLVEFASGKTVITFLSIEDLVLVLVACRPVKAVEHTFAGQLVADAHQIADLLVMVLVELKWSVNVRVGDRAHSELLHRRVLIMEELLDLFDIGPSVYELVKLPVSTVFLQAVGDNLLCVNIPVCEHRPLLDKGPHFLLQPQHLVVYQKNKKNGVSSLI